MATSSDARDIMGLASGPRQPAPKKKKRVEPQQRPSGVSREVQQLMGDSVPPVAIVAQKQYKAKAPHNRLFKTRHWEMRPFQHGARSDGLVLKHWKRSIPSASRAQAVTTPTDIEMTDGQKEPATVLEALFESEFPSERWNVKVEVPSYTDEQYENTFKSEDWTREETDYLLELCRELDLRWVLIADRYDPQAVKSGESYPTRTMEAVKSRYYTIAAKMMETHTPASNMTQGEFQLWEKMRNFDAKTETLRKAMAEKLFERTKDEADEERILLEELHRITKNEEDFIRLRRDLYSRLESAPAIRRTERGEEQSTAMYQTSAGLTALLQTLLAKERKLKRPTLPNGEQQPQQTPIDRRGQPNQYSRRDTLDLQADGPQKKGSTSQPNVRTLTAAEEVKFGVSHPQERLTSGVQFRHQKIDRLTMAKSQVQTSKIQAALTQLSIPPRLLMPTERVCREFERLVESIHKLLDCRKSNEKITSEIKVLEEMRRIRLGLPKEGEQLAQHDAMDVDTSQVTEELKSDAVNGSTMVEDQDAEGEDDDAEGEKEEAADESAMQVDDQEDDDAEAEEDDEAGDKSAVAEDDDEDDEYADLGKDDDDEEDEQDEEDEEPAAAEDSDEEEEEDGDAEAEVDASEEEQEANESDAAEESDGEEQQHEDEVEEEEDAEAEAEASEPEASRPSSSHSALARAHKRSASVISDASKAGSNRSGLGRKKRR